ncbi:MAG: SDR family oxidoreductase [Acetobacteraceae bacterium]|nr:SDR family oxidoreductase [Acetobacteraceae bacterium]
MRFRDCKVVITGAAGVYGRELAAGFAGEGARLLLTDRDLAPLAAASAALPAERTILHQADLAKDVDIDRLVAAANEGGAPHVLVNNAGIYPFIPLMEVTGAEYDLMLDVNLRAPFRLMQGIGRAMAALGRGSIVNVTSAAAEVIRGNGVPYGASKCALEFFTRAFALELGPSGVRVNSARPGFFEGSAQVTMPAGYAQAISARATLRRPIREGEFTRAVMWLCSDDAAYVTGSVLDSGGGGHINKREGAATAARA